MAKFQILNVLEWEDLSMHKACFVIHVFMRDNSKMVYQMDMVDQYQNHMVVIIKKVISLMGI